MGNLIRINGEEVYVISCGPATADRTNTNPVEILKSEKQINNGMPKTFEEKAEVYAIGEVEIQKLIKDAEIQKFIKKYGKHFRIYGKPSREPLSEEEIAKIRNDYEKTHPAYASVRKECENIKKNHDKTIEKLMRRYDIANIESEEDKKTKTEKRNAYKKDIEKQYRKDNPDYDLLVKTEKYFNEKQKEGVIPKPKIFDETDILKTTSGNDLYDKLIEAGLLEF